MGQNVSLGQGDAFPYQFEPGEFSFVHRSSQFSWQLAEAHETATKKPVSLFVLEPATSILAENFLKRCKTLRHPYVVNYINGMVMDDQNKMYIVTEKLEPLATKLPELLPQSISWGLYQIAKALEWLNGNGLVHANVNLESVFVAQNGDWRLGGLEYVSKIDEIVGNKSFILNDSLKQTSSNLVWPPELTTGKAPATDLPTACIDSWLLGCFIYSLFNQIPTGPNPAFEKTQLKDTSKIPAELELIYTKLLTASPKTRSAPTQLCESAYFSNPFVDMCLFLEQISVKDMAERNHFYRSVPGILKSISPSVAKYKLLPSILNAPGKLDSDGILTVLSLSTTLPEQEAKEILPSNIIKWFAIPDRAIRTGLLTHIEFIGKILDKNQVETIWPQFAQGFVDTTPQLRELTVRSVVSLAPLLSETVLNNTVLKFLAGMQGDPEPGIRSNTTICIGLIAKYLLPETRHKVLVPALGRATKDPANIARKAALSALVFSKTYFTPSEVATQILGLVASLMVDPSEEVRKSASNAIQVFLQILEENSAKLGDTPDGTKSQTQDEGWMGWGLNSLSKMVSKGEEPEKNPPQTQQNKSTSNTTNPPKRAPEPKVEPSRPKPAQEPKPKPKPVEKPKETKGLKLVSTQHTSHGWEEEDGGGWDADDWEPVVLPTKPTTKATPPSKPVSASTSLEHLPRESQKPKVTTTISSGWDDDDWGDTDSWTSNKSTKKNGKDD